MKSNPDLHRDDFGASPAVAIQLFCAILGPNAHPIDRLASRCAASDGPEWSSQVLAELMPAPKSIDGWIAWKNRAKDGIHESDLHTGDPLALAAFLQYVASIAGALALDGTYISKTSPAEIRRALNVIGPTVEPSWRDIFSSARIRLDEIKDIRLTK
ncbi:MAG: hypothetical protein O2875_04335 [Planctomycetota bacterium]|nr:hypothetical protein [Planctomycetota bacterium]MDA1262807.1 hypothetical protein [Planctomycetota bacterium]